MVNDAFDSIDRLDKYPKCTCLMQLHANQAGRFVGLNYDFSRQPCERERVVKLPADPHFSESAPVPVWLPATTPVLTKREPVLNTGIAPL